MTGRFTHADDRLGPGALVVVHFFRGDPCHLGRHCGIYDAPRNVLRAIPGIELVEMERIKDQSWCCGGGGGAVSIDEIREFRTKTGGKRKADQIRETGAKFVVAPCANCKKQIAELIDYHKIDAQCIGLHDLILKAIRIPGAIQPGSNGNGNPTGD